MFEHHRQLKHLAPPSPPISLQNLKSTVDVETVEWGQRRFNARGYPHSDVLLERASPEVRGAHYAGRSPRGALINSERASIWVQASSSSASPTHCRWKETWGDANLTSLCIWMRSLFAQLRVSSCRAQNAFMHMHSHILATGLEQLQWDAERSRSEEWTVYVSLAQR